MISHHTIIIELHNQAFGGVIPNGPVLVLFVNPDGMAVLDTDFERLSKHEGDVRSGGFAVFNFLGLFDIKILTDGSTPKGPGKTKEQRSEDQKWSHGYNLLKFSWAPRPMRDGQQVKRKHENADFPMKIEIL
jgi:hypothetical protein